MKAKYFVLFLIIVVAACKSKENKQDLEVSVAPQDTVQIVEPEPSPEPVVKIVDEGVNQDDKYFLVINSYAVEEIALEKKKLFEDKGYKADLVMKDEDGYFRLALKSFNDIELAENALEEMQKEEEFNEMWLMSK